MLLNYRYCYDTFGDTFFSCSDLYLYLFLTASNFQAISDAQYNPNAIQPNDSSISIHSTIIDFNTLSVLTAISNKFQCAKKIIVYYDLSYLSYYDVPLPVIEIVTKCYNDVSYGNVNNQQQRIYCEMST